MDTEYKLALLEAVNVLSKSKDAPHMYQELLELLPAAARLGARFSGDRAVMNPLLRLWTENHEQFERVVGLIESKRAAAQLPPLSVPKEEGFNKADYMREFMAQKRERERRAAEIENMMRDEASQLRGRARLDFMQMQSARWKAQRDEMLAAFRQKIGRRPKSDEIKNLLAQFWARVDQELDGLEELARVEKLGVRKAR